MGGRISNLIGRNSDANDDLMDENLRKYHEAMDGGETFIGDESDKKKVAWWERIFFDKRARIGYIFVLGVILGLIIPAIIFATQLENKGKPIYGSCLIKPHARFQCLLNSEEPVNEESCTRAFCCWAIETDGLEFNCYHSFPSAYQYNVSESQTGSQNVRGENGTRAVASPWANLELRPSRADLMAPLKVLTNWQSQEHLVVQMFNSEVFPNRKVSVGRNAGDNRQNAGNDKLPLTVEWSEDEAFFFLRIARRDTDETIFDTRLGPVYTSDKDFTLATLLPTKYFYGLKGGQGSPTTQTFATVNGFENSEFPFYISFEESGKWHGVLIDTTEPILVQAVQAPGLLFHLETPEINLHFFPGPTQPQILSQLHAYIKEKYNIAHAPMVPPYWGLGLHLCRKLDNSSEVLTHVQRLMRDLDSLAYDTDCIDEYLRHPIAVDEDRFSPNLTDILNLLLRNGKTPKRIILSQKTTIPTKDMTFASGNIQADFQNVLVMDINDSSKKVPFEGRVNGTAVNYIDFFHPDISSLKFPPVPTIPNKNSETDEEPLQYHGFSLDDNFPELELASKLCPNPGSRLQSYFTTRLETSSNDANVTGLWGTLCPLSTVHKVGNVDVPHIRLHNTYGEQALKVVHSTTTERQEELLLSSSSISIAGLYYGAFNGMPVPFTWKGLQASVENTVRNYALAPIAGIPICGSMMRNNVTIPMNKDLCMRFFQFGLLLPFARNSYDNSSSYGPYHFPGIYQDYLNDTIRHRYTYAPYYFTELLKYQKTFVPLVRPMSFDFSRPHEREDTLPLLTQFMIGDAIFAAPIIDRGNSRLAFFPAGPWYAMDGREVSTSLNVGVWQSITGLITETPIYLRGGYMIPLLENPVGLTIEDSLQGNYTLSAGLSSKNTPIRTANGTLTVVEPTSNNSIVHDVQFSISVNQSTSEDTKIVINVMAACGSKTSPISTIIDQVRILGLPHLGDKLKVVVTPLDSHDSYLGRFTYFGEQKSLRIYRLQMDWCKSTKYEVVVEQMEEDANTTPNDSVTTEGMTTSDSTTTTDDMTTENSATTN